MRECGCVRNYVSIYVVDFLINDIRITIKNYIKVVHKGQILPLRIKICLAFIAIWRKQLRTPSTFSIKCKYKSGRGDMAWSGTWKIRKVINRNKMVLREDLD